MIEIVEMNNNEMDEMLTATHYGHLGCAEGGRPFVVPVHFSFHGGHLYVYTTEGKKSAIIRDNPSVCLQVESVIDDGDWRSVVVNGLAERIEDPEEKQAALEIVLAVNPKLTPAVSVKWANNWIRENVEVIYRIRPDSMTGRQARHVVTHAAIASGAGKRAIY